MSSTEISRIIEHGLASADAWQAVRTRDKQFWSKFDLSVEERELLNNSPTPDTLAKLGVPPLLAMWGSFMCNADFEASMSVGEYFEKSQQGGL
ncbi:hypothetical protein K875_00004 [Mycobacterium [tuberculosis] TKK-01-0051]|uniref:Extradiol ring-cleavage dioxygenase LigAB LigA subunit domain-containing protein n=1 Tax=Mycobacterium [tuberculosis] TKK-01-0051 TaxID=1324261 RepID=A0A051UJ90_9MYCO|nr:hypothetical protein [Mycobacterium colombiense]KBZ69289.1 hypothetical protein K875_00004 [Mycobacterium [tuberculosis] TKK-01-0051]